MPDPRDAGFTRVTYLDGDLLFLPRAAYDGLTTALTTRTEVAGELVRQEFWVGEEIEGLDVVVRLSEVREVLDVTAQVRAGWKAAEATERLTGGSD